MKRQSVLLPTPPDISAFGDKVLIDGKVFDPRTGRVIEILPPRPANTFVQNWLKLLYVMMGHTTLAGVVDTGGTSRTANGSSYSELTLNAALNGTTFGIVIGNQVAPAAVTLSDTKLQAQVTANVAHAAVTFSLNAPDGTHYQLIVSRMFTNNTGATLNITEVGLYSYDTGGGFIWCVDRTLMSVNLGATLATTLAYTWTTHT